MILNCVQLSKLQNFSCDCVVLEFSLLHYLDLNAIVDEVSRELWQLVAVIHDKVDMV